MATDQADPKPGPSEGTAPFRGPKSIGPIDMLRGMFDPKSILDEVSAVYGDTFTIPDKTNPGLMTGNPGVIKAILTADSELYEVPYLDTLAPLFGGTSLILTSGPKHKKDRKLLAPAFHGARMKSYGKTIVDSSLEVMSKLEKTKPFVMIEQCQAISLKVILRAIFGIVDPERLGLFHTAVVSLMEATNSPAILAFPSLRRNFGGFGPWARLQRALSVFDKLVYEEIENRRKITEPREDILSVLLGARYDDGAPMSEVEIRDQLHLLVFAGHDTTSTGLAWAFYWLHREKAMRDKVLAELSALGPNPEPDKIVALPYLDAVCHETLRIHPIAATIARKLKEPLVVQGNTLEAQWILTVSLLMLHNRPDLYPEPETFRPERFIERTFSPYEYMPFGGGSRRCLGAALAMYEMKLVLATVLSNYSLKLISDAPVKAQSRGLTMGPKGGIPMRLMSATAT